MTTPLLPSGRIIAAVPPRADALATIARQVYRRRAVRRRRAYVVAIALPLALVATTLSLTRTGSHSLQPITQLPHEPSATANPTGGTDGAGGSLAGIGRARGDGSSAAPASGTLSAGSQPAGVPPQPNPAGPRLIPIHREFTSNGTTGMTCPRGVAQDGWCVSAVTSMPKATAPAVDVAVRVCRSDPVDGTLTWPTTQEVDLAVWSGGTEVYRWSARQRFEPYPHSEVLSVQGNIDRQPVEDNPSQCMLWKIVWPVIDDAGRSLDRNADYTLHAWTVAEGLSDAVAVMPFSAVDGSSDD